MSETTCNIRQQEAPTQSRNSRQRQVADSAQTVREKVSPVLKKRMHVPNSLQVVTQASTAPFTILSISAYNRYRLLQACISFSPLQADTDNECTTERWPLISNTSRPYGKRMHSLQLLKACTLFHFILLKHSEFLILLWLASLNCTQSNIQRYWLGGGIATMKREHKNTSQASVI